MTVTLAFGVSNLANFCLKINSPTVSLQLCVGLRLKVIHTDPSSPASRLLLFITWNQKLVVLDSSGQGDVKDGIVHGAWFGWREGIFNMF